MVTPACRITAAAENDMIKDIARAVFHRLPSGIAAPVRDAFYYAHDSRKIRKEVGVAAEQIRKMSLDSRGQKIFVDCGFNTGAVLKRFMGELPGFQSYGFEVNEARFGRAAEKIKAENDRVLGLNFAAVSDHDGEVSFQEMGTKSGRLPMQGTSIIEGLDPGIPRGEAQSVASVDFAKWLQETYLRHANGAMPFVAVKMDIEGAEYPVLERLLDTEAIEFVDHLTVEFHSWRFPKGPERDEIIEREQKIRDALASHRDLYVHEWF